VVRRAHRPRRFVALAGAVLIGIGLVALAPMARADEPRSSVSADNDGVRIEIDRRAPGRSHAVAPRVRTAPRSTPTTARATATTSCRLVRIPARLGLAPRFRNGDPARPLTPFSVVCAGRVTGIVFLERPTRGGGGVAPVSEQLVQQIALPIGTVRASPGVRGITGLESWFWIEGYDGAPVTATVQALGASVDVEATPTAETWDFGDDTGEHAGDLGRAAPQRSSVVHTFERASGTAPFVVTLDFEYAVRYRVDNGPWITLPPVHRSATLTYAVTEVRSQLVAD